jgi:hypothetical protein
MGGFVWIGVKGFTMNPTILWPLVSQRAPREVICSCLWQYGQVILRPAPMTAMIKAAIAIPSTIARSPNPRALPPVAPTAKSSFHRHLRLGFEINISIYNF